MLDLGPAFITVGQVLSTRPDIVPPIYVQAFATLQDEVPEAAGDDPFDVLKSELGDDLDLETVEPIAGLWVEQAQYHVVHGVDTCRHSVISKRICDGIAYM